MDPSGKNKEATRYRYLPQRKHLATTKPNNPSPQEHARGRIVTRGLEPSVQRTRGRRERKKKKFLLFVCLEGKQNNLWKRKMKSR